MMEKPDTDIVTRVLAGHTNEYELLMRRYNQRLFRIGISILHNESEVQEAMQETYIRAYEQLSTFEGRSSFGTWLTRIMINDCLGRKSRRQRVVTAPEESLNQLLDHRPGPDDLTYQNQLRVFLENAIQQLPDAYQTVFIMREIELLSGRETAESLQISESNVKVRLHRAKAMLRKTISQSAVGSEVFSFRGARCDRLVQAVFQKLHVRPHGNVHIVLS